MYTHWRMERQPCQQLLLSLTYKWQTLLMIWPCILIFISFLPVYSSAPTSIDVEIPSFRTVMMTESAVTATCSVQTLFDAKVTWLMDGGDEPSSTVNQKSNTTHIISDVSVPFSQWKQLKSITCKAEHKCLSSTQRTVNLPGIRRLYDIEIRHMINAEDCQVVILLSVSFRSCSYRSISGDQEISPRFAEGTKCCARVRHHKSLLQWPLRHLSGKRWRHLWKTVCWPSCSRRPPFNQQTLLHPSESLEERHNFHLQSPPGLLLRLQVRVNWEYFWWEEFPLFPIITVDLMVQPWFICSRFTH